MKVPKLALVALAVLPVATVALQERASKKKEKDFPAVMTAASEAWKDHRFGACLGSLREATHLAYVKYAQAIQAALPAAPAGFTAKPDTSYGDSAAAPLVGALSAGFGTVISQSYQPEGRGRAIQVTVTADSPLVQMLGMVINNPAMLPKGSELIKYGAHSALLEQKSGGKSRGLQILIHGKDLVDVQFPSDDEDALFAMFDQAAVDRLAQALAR